MSRRKGRVVIFHGENVWTECPRWNVCGGFWGIFHGEMYGGNYWGSARIEAPRGWGLGRGCPSGVRCGGALPPTHFWRIWGPQNTSGRENSVTTSQQSLFFSCNNIHSIDDWGMPPWLRPCSCGPGNVWQVTDIWCEHLTKLVRVVVCGQFVPDVEPYNRDKRQDVVENQCLG